MAWTLASSFHLTKWYGDCVSEDGTAFVGYAATLCLGPLMLPYQATLLSVPGHPLRERSTLTRRDHPEVGSGQASWSSKALGVSASWKARAPPIHQLLLDAPHLRIEWRCQTPHAEVTVALKDHPDVLGMGYVEELEMWGDPRRIPIRELRWGRFHSADAWAVWIDWRGDHPLRRVWVNGAEVPDADVLDDGLALGGGGRIAFHEARDFRHGDVAESVFPGRPWLQRLLPRSVRHLDEHKWVGRATLCTDGSTSEGWALFETVTWP